MRKRLLTILFCVTMVASTLCGCGSKETVAEPVESTSIEEIVVEESSEPVSVEETTTSKPIEEPVPEPTTEVNEKLDIVVELSTEFQQAKDEKIPIGEEVQMEFGTIVRLGDNEDYPNALENVEIHYMDKVFQVALPKDMCVKFKSDKEAQQLNVYNEDVPTESCDKHVQVEYCITGGGVANDYCSRFGNAEVGTRSLVKMTQAEVEEIRSAANVGLTDIYLHNGYTYYLDGAWHGFNGRAQVGEDLPYLVCPIHNAESWSRYELENGLGGWDSDSSEEEDDWHGPGSDYSGSSEW